MTDRRDEREWLLSTQSDVLAVTTDIGHGFAIDGFVLVADIDRCNLGTLNHQRVEWFEQILCRLAGTWLHCRAGLRSLLGSLLRGLLWSLLWGILLVPGLVVGLGRGRFRSRHSLGGSRLSLL